MAWYLTFSDQLPCAAQTVNYTYDDAGRLISVNYGSAGSIAYTYDASGNLLRRDVTSSAPFATVSAASFEPKRTARRRDDRLWFRSRPGHGH